MTSITEPAISTEQPRRRASSEVQADQPTVVLRLPNLYHTRHQELAVAEPLAPPLSKPQREPSTDYVASIGDYWANVRSWLDTHPVRQGALLSWIWRGGVALAAVGLVGLAYYIINNPAADPGDEANGQPDSQTTASSEVQIEDDTANWTIESQRLEPQQPVTTTETWHSHSPANPRQPRYPTGGSDQEVPGGMEKVPPRFALPTNPPASSSNSNPADDSAEDGLSRRPWDSGETQTTPRSDEAARRSSWNTPNSPRGGTDFVGSEQSPDARVDSLPDSNATQYDYPTTDPATWRYANRLGEGAQLEPPQQQSWPPVGSQYDSRETARPPIARLHGDIERTPVRR